MKILKIEELLQEEKFQLTESNKQCTIKSNTRNLSSNSVR